MQAQSASDPPKKIGARRARGHGRRRRLRLSTVKDAGEPVEIVYPTEGTPQIVGPERGVQGGAQSERGAAVPGVLLHAPNASSSCSTSRPCIRSHPAVKEKPGRNAVRARSSVHEGRSRGGDRSRRDADQGALHQTLPRLMTLASPSRARPRLRRSASICRGRSCSLFAAVLCVLIVLPLSWLVYFAFHDKTGGFTLANFVDAC